MKRSDRVLVGIPSRHMLPNTNQKRYDLNQLATYDNIKMNLRDIKNENVGLCLPAQGRMKLKIIKKTRSGSLTE